MPRLRNPHNQPKLNSKKNKSKDRARHAQTRQRALAALGYMRRERLSLTKASRLAGIKPSTVVRHVGSALKRDTPGGRFYASKGDSFKRELRIPTALGMTTIPVYGSKNAYILASYLNAVSTYLRTGKTKQLEKFAARSLVIRRQQIELLTDPGVLSLLAEADALHFDQLYASVAGA